MPRLFAICLCAILTPWAAAQVPDCLSAESVALPRAFVNAPQCMAAWTDALRSTVPATQQRARAALALIGGREAVDALRADYERQRDPIPGQPGRRSPGAVINAMATTGSDADVQFLIGLLSLPLSAPPGVIPPWADVQAAALALGFLHAETARDSLRAVAQRAQPSTFVRSAAVSALSMLDHPPCADSVTTPTAGELLRIVIACNPSFMYTSTAFRDESSGRVWTYVDSTWRARPLVKSDTSVHASVSASVILVPSGDEAFVYASTGCGMLCGEGWTYRLRRNGRVWRVIGATFNWVS